MSVFSQRQSGAANAGEVSLPIDRTEDLNASYYSVVKKGRCDYWRYMAAPRGRVATTLSILAGSPPESIVDLGCGDGSLLLKVAPTVPNAKLAGIDRSSAQIEVNRKDYPAISWHAMDLDSTEPPADGMHELFDAVISLEVIEHVARPASLLSHAFSLARPGGRLLLSTQSGPVRETEKRVGHRRHFSAAQMDDLLKSVGWRPVRVWNSGWPFHDLSKWMANLSPDRSMRQFGEDSYTRGQKILCAFLRGLYKMNSTRRGAQLFALAEKL